MAALSTRYGGAGCMHEGAPRLARAGSLKRTRSGKLQGSHVKVVEHTKVQDSKHLDAALIEIDGKGGEGLMLREPGSKYKAGRQRSLLKVKSFHDLEAEVVALVGGDGKHTGLMGALRCKLPPSKKSKTFKVGTGFTDAQRKDPPSVGDIITIKCPELTAYGVPRFPVFVGVRIDMTKEQFLAIE